MREKTITPQQLVEEVAIGKIKVTPTNKTKTLFPLHVRGNNGFRVKFPKIVVF